MSIERQLDATESFAALAQLLVDARLTQEEKRSVSEEVEGLAASDDNFRRIRNAAFRLLSARIGAEHEAADLVGWLEEIVLLIDKASLALGATRSEVAFSPGPKCLELLTREINSARRSLAICVFTIADDRISREILAAHRRNVVVRVITDNIKRFDRGSDVDEFRRAGIDVRYDTSDAHMHHKFAVVDDRRLVNGSFNWTRSASEANEENLVLTDDRNQVVQFSKRFEHLWSSLSVTQD